MPQTLRPLTLVPLSLVSLLSLHTCLHVTDHQGLKGLAGEKVSLGTYGISRNTFVFLFSSLNTFYPYLVYFFVFFNLVSLNEPMKRLFVAASGCHLARCLALWWCGIALCLQVT